MKKLLFMLAAVAAAVSAQAAYVDWQYSVTEAKSGGTDWTATGAGYTAYLLTASDWSDLQAAGVTAAGLATAALDSSGFYSSGGTKSAVYYSTGTSGVGTARQVAADSGDFYIIIGSGSGYTVGLGPATISAYDDPTQTGTGRTPGITQPPAAGSLATGSDLRTTMAATPYSTGGGGGTGGVPEPTSGLLLALGGAMLALRRKCA